MEKKPPLGIAPRYIFVIQMEEKRLEAINDAIAKRAAEGVECPAEWYAEREAILKFLELEYSKIKK